MFESNIKDDCFVKCILSVFKDFSVERASQISVPLGNIQQILGHFLENENGVDVIFEVGGQIVSAHKCKLLVNNLAPSKYQISKAA